MTVPEVAAEVAAPRMTARHKLILVLLLGTQFMLSVDFSILNVALPDIGRGLGMSLSTLQWVATAFALPAAGFTLLFGRVADLFGRRRLFMTGLVLLAVGSVVGGVANTSTLLLIGRVVQGVATAITIPAALSLITTSFPEGPLRQRALGLNGALLSAGFTVGALFGGLLTDLLSWRWAFLVNAPIAVVLLVAAPALLAAGRERSSDKLDVAGAITVTGGLLALVYGVTEASHTGWTEPVTLLVLAIAIALLVAFAVIETRAAHPLASVRVLTKRTVGWGNLGGFVTFTMASGLVFLLTLYLQNVLGYSALVTGIAFGVPGIAACAAGIIAPRFIGRIGAQASLVIGLAVQGLATVAMLFIGQDRAGIVLVMVSAGVGFFGHVYGIVAYMVTATSGLPDHEQGLATGLTTMTQQVGLTMGIPVLSAIASAGVGAGAPADTVLGGLRLAIGVDAAVVLVGAALIAAFLGVRRPVR
ncbi:MFS transporter [Solihabitans fulvus]|uniref:MFS transporter n=1 Tax=Solihabitans fulvus TaxID=1892852 RepID=A0A5B2WWY7_9PSEU|nr:MFS transporter [Solihabitans fulvus]